MCALWSVALLLSTWCAAAHDGDCAWPPMEAQHRPGAYWHWMGSAVDEANLTRELETFHAAGMGGVHLVPIYGAKGYEDRYIEYLSPRWMSLLAHVVREAERLGMWVDMSTGTGWNFGGPNIPGELANASVHTKIEKGVSKAPCSMKLARKPLQAALAFNEGGQVIDLSDAVTTSGHLEWTPPDGIWTVIALWQEPAKKVERPAPGGAGWMLNPFQNGAMRHYLDRFDAAFTAYNAPMPRAMYHDSYEYKGDWSPDLFAEFERRRGYRLQDRLDVFFGDTGSEEQARLKSDYRETLAGMMLDNALGVWADWSRQLGCLTRNQAHGSPGNLLDLYAVADIPETEMFNQDRDPLVAKFASSAAHVMGKRRVAAETGTWLRDHFNVTLGDLKMLIDDLFISGVNQTLYHGTCYSPADVPWPGWLFYASTQMNPRNAMWHDVLILNTYIARCQSLLQTTEPDNDVLLYWPIHDLWHNPKGMEMNLSIHRSAWLTEQSVGRAAKRLWERGYGFDYISDRQLANLKATPKGLLAPGGVYRLLLVPNSKHMPLETMKRLRDLAEAGAVIAFEGSVPHDVPGLAKLEKRRAVLSSLTENLVEPGVQTLGKGRILVDDDIEILLHRAGVVREALADTPGILYIRRRHEEGRLYFLANRGNQNIAEYLPLARPARGAALLDPMTGQTGVAALRKQDGRPAVFVQLAPGQSIVVRTLAERTAKGSSWPYLDPEGKSISLEGEWTVEFIEGGPVLPPPCKLSRLTSWTEFPEGPETVRFAGTARYSITFDLPPEKTGNVWRLDLGAVAESARVRLNGKEIGAVILPPWRIDLDADIVKPQGNLLEIEVTNLSANRIRDLDRSGVEWRIFNDINFVNIDYKPFNASEWPIRSSGLLGPVTLVRLVELANPL